VKLRSPRAVHLEETLLVIRRRGRVLMRRREAGARRMAGFWDLPTPRDLPAAKLGNHLGEFRHTITHHHYVCRVIEAAAPKGRAGPGFTWMTTEHLDAAPLSTTARKALRLAGVMEDARV
jgi:adenine-specific DNA glycosylase